MAQGRTGARN